MGKLIARTASALALFLLSTVATFGIEVTFSSSSYPNYNYTGSTAVIRFYASETFVASDGTVIGGGTTPGSKTGFFKAVTCSVSGGTLTCPSFTLYSTTDSPDKPSVTWTAKLFDAQGTARDFFPLSDFRLTHTLGSTVTIAQIINDNAGTRIHPNPGFYTIDQTNAAITAAIASGDPATTTTLGRAKISKAATDPSSPVAAGANEKFIVAQASAGLENEQSLGALTTGLVKNTVSGTTGTLSTATDGTDYLSPASAPITLLNALNYGVLNNGTAQSTTNLQAAITAAAAQVSSISTRVGVYLPPGNYRFNSGSLTLPQGVSLVGSWQLSAVHTWKFNGASQPDATDGRGTTFLIDTGAGSSSGGFITQHANTLVKGISFYYPNQTQTAVTPTVYPPTLLLGGDVNQTMYDQHVVDCEFVNSYQAIKARYGGRYLFRNLRGYPVYGIDVDKSYAESWAENINFNAYLFSSFASAPPADNYFKYVSANGIAIKLGRVDAFNILSPYLLGYNKAVATVTTANEGALPGGSAWAKVVGGGAEASIYGVHLDGVSNFETYGFDVTDSYDPTGANITFGLVTTANVGPDSRVLIHGGKFGWGSGNSQRYNFSLSGGGQVLLDGVYCYNAIVSNVLGASSIANAMNLTISGGVFNAAGFRSVDLTGYVAGTCAGANFIQVEAARAIVHSGLGGYTFTDSGCRYLDDVARIGVSGANATRWFSSGAAYFPQNVEFGNGVNAHGTVEVQGIASGTSGFGTIATNAIYNRTTLSWNRQNTAADAWLFQMGSTTGGTSGAAILYAAPGANPITWTPYLNLAATGKVELQTTATAAGTTGAQTINKPTGSVNFAAGASSLVVTNSLVTASSQVFCAVQTNDATAVVKNCVAGAGSFTINLSAAATAETRVSFFVVN